MNALFSGYPLWLEVSPFLSANAKKKKKTNYAHGSGFTTDNTTLMRDRRASKWTEVPTAKAGKLSSIPRTL